MSFKREMDLEERLNKIASKAVRKPSQEEFTNPFKSSVSKPTSTSKELTDVNDIRQLNIEAQLAKISTNSILEKLGNKPSKIKSEVTKEMILDYQNEMLKPIEIEDEFGNKTKYKYHPSSIDVDLETYVPLHVVLTQAEKTDLFDEMTRIARRIEGLKYELSRIMQENVLIKTEFDRRLGRIRSSAVLRMSEKVRAIKDETDRFDATITLNEAEQIANQDEILNLEAEIQRLQFVRDTNYELIRENQAEERRVKNINAPRLRAYEADLNLLNRGRLNVSQAPNESDEDYKQRLRDTGQTTADDDAMEASSQLYYRDKLREQVLELIRDTGIISNAIKFLTNEQAFKITQNWPRIKRDFIKAYGFDNKSVKERDLIDFFEKEVDPIIEDIEKSKPPRPPPELFGEVVEPEFAKATVLGEPEKKRYDELLIDVRDKKGGREKLRNYHRQFNKTPTLVRSAEDTLELLVNEDLVSDRNPDGSERGVIRVKKSPAKSSLSEALSASLAKRVFKIDELQAIADPVLAKIKKDQQQALSGADEVNKTRADKLLPLIRKAEAGLRDSDIDKFYDNLDTMEAEVPDVVIRETRDNVEFAEIYPRAITGNGLQPIKHDIPNLIEFGKVKISPRKLYYNNTLVIKHKSGNSLAGLTNVQVSDKFVSIIMNLLKGKKPSLKDFNQLDLSEKGIYDSLIYIAGLGKEVDNNFSETKQHLKNRLELVEGEIGAGNNNPALKKELHGLLGKMAHTGMIGYGDAKRYYLSVTK